MAFNWRGKNQPSPRHPSGTYIDNLNVPSKGDRGQGFSWTGSRHDGGVNPINKFNRAQVHKNRSNATGSIGGGGRSKLDNQRGFSWQGPSNFTPHHYVQNFNKNANIPASVLSDDEAFAFTDENLGKNILQDAGRMVSDLTPDIDIRMPGIMGLFGDLGKSIGQNRRDHKIINKAFGRASPRKNAEFFDRHIPVGTSWRDIGEGTGLSDAGKAAMNRFNRAGITDQVMARFLNPNDKWGGNEAWLASHAGAEGAEDFKQGMSFIKNAKDSAQLARSLVANQQQGPGTDTRANQNFVDVKNAMEAMSGLGIAPKADEIWEGVTEDITADVGGDITEDIYGAYPGPEDDVLWGEPNPNYYESRGLYESPLTDDFYNEQLIDKTPERPSHSKHIWRPRDSVYPLNSVMNEDEITPNYLDPSYFEQYITVDDDEEMIPKYNNPRINPAWNR